MAARKKAAKRGAKKRTTRKKAAKRRVNRKRATGARAAGKKAAKKKAAKKKAAKKKAAKKAAPAPVTITVVKAWPRPGTLKIYKRQEVVWVNEDAEAYTIEFAESPFVPGPSGETIELPAGPGASVTRTVHPAKKKGTAYHYDLVGVPRTGHPPTEPQVIVGD